MHDSLSSTSSENLAPTPRYVLRAIPLLVSCYFELEEIKRCAPIVVEEMERLSSLDPPAAPKKATFGIQFKRRLSNDAPDRSSIISAVADLVPPSFSVDLSDPDYTILVEVFKNMVGIGVVKDYAGKRKLNLVELNVGGATSTNTKTAKPPK